MTTERRITLQDGIARVEDVTLIAAAPATGILPAFASRLPTIMPVLPEGTVAYKYDPNTKFGAILVSRKPQVVTLSISNDSEDYAWEPEDDEWTAEDIDGYKQFRVAMPYTHFLWTFTSSTADPTEAGTTFTFGEVYPYWSPAKLVAATSGVVPLELPNIWSDGYICWGGVESDRGSFASRIDSRVNAFFDTLFNADLDLRRPYYSSFAEWAQATREDEQCWTTWPFYPSRTVAQLLDRYDTVEVPQGREGWSPPPERFTVARAREWARTVPPDARRRLLAGLSAAVTELDAEPTPAPTTAPRFQVLEDPDGRQRVTDTQSGRILLGAYRAPETLERLRQQLEDLAGTGNPIPTHPESPTAICNCIASDGYHNLRIPGSYPDDFFTTQGHRQAVPS